ncbi:MAG: hypothetical protein J6S21_03085 [Victivallales bacterium]|nr:hypothetical protein [Victivallales bacterium]
MPEPVQVMQPAPEPSAPVSVPEPAPVVEAAPATTEVQELPPLPQEEYCEEYTGGCEVIVTDVPVQAEAEVQPEAPQKLSAAELFRSMQVNAPLETPASEVPQAPAGSNYRRVTPEEYRDLSNHPAAQEIVRELNAEIYDVRKRISE